MPPARLRPAETLTDLAPGDKDRTRSRQALRFSRTRQPQTRSILPEESDPWRFRDRHHRPRVLHGARLPHPWFHRPGCHCPGLRGLVYPSSLEGRAFSISEI